MSLPILLINLAESRSRLDCAQQELNKAGISFERLEATDGRKIAKADFEKITHWDKTAFYKPLSPGEVGCYLSHVSAAEKIVNEDWPYALVLEDDFRLAPNFNEVMALLLRNTPAGFHLIKLQGFVRGGEVVANLCTGHQIMRHRSIPTQTVAQLWSLAGAKAFLAMARPLRRPIDVQLKHWWEGDLNILYINPPIVIDGDAKGVTSTIGARKPKGILNWFRRLRYKSKFTCQSHLNYFRRNGLLSWFRSLRR